MTFALKDSAGYAAVHGTIEDEATVIEVKAATLAFNGQVLNSESGSCGKIGSKRSVGSFGVGCVGGAAGFDNRSGELRETHGWNGRHREDQAKRPDCWKHGSHYSAGYGLWLKNFHLR
jgi:hypothetical protein